MKAVPAPLERVDVRVHGRVQGVGFRPFAYRLASELGLTGWVLNNGEGVRIQVQGEGQRIARFVTGMRRGPVGLSRVDDVQVSPLGTIDERGFQIRHSESATVSTDLAPDSATCADCLEELFDPHDARYRYAFTNCTRCGPRYTITRRLPYDRANTSMDEFPLCGHCAAEYRDPGDRRFHAEPNACPVCGPQLSLLDAEGTAMALPDPLATVVSMLTKGKIVAVKGLGGFHLACDARNGAAVARLRERKQRDSKPFAIMVAAVASVAEMLDVDDEGRALLQAPERPIVLLPKRAACDTEFPGVAPGVGCLGVMLPYTPLHYLLFHEAAGRPSGVAWLAEGQPLALVMTSANATDEPLAHHNDEVGTRLLGLADAFLVHDRAIVQRCDDSVIRADRPAPLFVRRARGYTPVPLPLPESSPPILAVGGGLKNTVCLTRGDRAYVSQHNGNLESRAARLALQESVDHMIELLAVEPRIVARDLHPDYASSQFAETFAQTRGLPVVTVQHHLAHAAAVIAEHGLRGPVLGLVLDGVGLGSDRGVWGGELLLVDGAAWERVGHLAPLPLPGGDAGAREPWRMAASALYTVGRGEELGRRWPERPAALVGEMLARGINCPPTSSAGRLFDAAAALLGVCEENRHEAEAAMALEALAERYGDIVSMEDGFFIAEGDAVDYAPLLNHLADGGDPARGAALFHATLAAGLGELTRRAAASRGVRQVVLAGGCLLNAVLRRQLRAVLEVAAVDVYEAEALPPNDGGLSFGQANVALLQWPQHDFDTREMRGRS